MTFDPCALGVAGCCHPDLLLVRPGAGLADRPGELQHVPQRRVQVGHPSVFTLLLCWMGFKAPRTATRCGAISRHIRGRFPKRLVTANRTTPGGSPGSFNGVLSVCLHSVYCSMIRPRDMAPTLSLPASRWFLSAQRVYFHATKTSSNVIGQHYLD